MKPELVALGAGVAAALVTAWAMARGPRWRRQMVACARQHVRDRTPYQWGGGHHGPSWGLDCSGLVLDCARAAGLEPGAWSSRTMAAGLPEVTHPEPGDVAVYAPRHVVLVESYDPQTGVAEIIGANGGGPSTTSPEVAEAQGARVRREPTHLYRSGFLGFRSTRPWAVKAGEA